MVRLFQSENVTCVTASQTVRLITSYLYDDIIGDDDVIVTADVDAFILSPDILKPLHDNPGVSVWVWQFFQYFLTPMIPMSFIGARSKTWKSLIKYDGDLSTMLNIYRQKRNCMIQTVPKPLFNSDNSNLATIQNGLLLIKNGSQTRPSYPGLSLTVVSAVSPPSSMDHSLTLTRAGEDPTLLITATRLTQRE